MTQTETEKIAESAIEHLSPPDLLLPIQWAEMHQQIADSPERRLTLAVLQDALQCALGRADICSAPDLPLRPRQQARLAEEAMRWLDDDSRRPFSAHWICDVLSLDLEALRAAIRRRIHLSPSLSQEEGEGGDVRGWWWR